MGGYHLKNKVYIAIDVKVEEQLPRFLKYGYKIYFKITKIII